MANRRGWHAMAARRTVAVVLPVLLIGLAACAPAANDEPAEVAGPQVPENLSTDSGEELGSGEGTEAVDVPDYEIISILPKDGIPAIDQPRYWEAEEADERYRADDLVIGVSLAGDHRAYSVPFLSAHELVNDTVGGLPISVTW